MVECIMEIIFFFIDLPTILITNGKPHHILARTVIFFTQTISPAFCTNEFQDPSLVITLPKIVLLVGFYNVEINLLKGRTCKNSQWERINEMEWFLDASRNQEF